MPGYQLGTNYTETILALCALLPKLRARLPSHDAVSQFTNPLDVQLHDVSALKIPPQFETAPASYSSKPDKLARL